MNTVTEQAKSSSGPRMAEVLMGFWKSVERWWTRAKRRSDAHERLRLDHTVQVAPLEPRRVLNAAPVVGNQAFEVSENAAANHVIATVAARDSDPGDSLTYSITAGNTNNVLAIDPATGELRVNAPSELTGGASISLTVRVTDPLGASDTANVSVAVRAVTGGNDAPTMNPQTFRVAGGSASGVVVGSVVANDPDGDSLTYSITAGNTGNAFAVNPSTGQITVSTPGAIVLPGTFNLTVRATDPGTNFASASITVVVNGAPTNLALSSTSLIEGAAGATVGALSVTDPNSGDSFRFTLSDARFEIIGGDLKLRAGQQVDFETESTIPLTIDVTDAHGGTYSEAFTIAVTNVNEAPVLTIPGTQTTNEDTMLPFSSTNGNGLTVADVDAGTSNLRVTLNVSNGTLTLTDRTGLTFNGGDGINDVSMIFRGTLSEINTSLNTLQFQPNSEFSGTSVLTVTVEDLGATGTGGSQSANGTVTISVTAVNDAPTATIAPTSFTVNEGASLTLGGVGLALSDVDAGTSEIELSLSVGTGTLQATPGALTLTITGSGTANLKVRGTVASLTSLLNGTNGATLSFTPAGDSPPSTTVLLMEVDDLGNAGSGGAKSGNDSVTISITGVNDPPVNTVPAAQSTGEDTPLIFSTTAGNAISISDPDAGTSDVRVTLGVTQGQLTLNGTAGLTFSTGDGTSDATMTFTGSMTAINTALNGLVFEPNQDFTGNAVLTLTTNDQGATGTGGARTDADSVTISVVAVNDPPVISTPASQSTNEDTVLIFAPGNGNAISISDPDAGTNDVEVAISVTSGSLTLSGTAGLTFIVGDGTNDASMMFQGSQSAVNAALNGLRFTPANNFAGTATIGISVDDQGNSGPGGPLVTGADITVQVLAVNDPPQVNLAITSYTTLEQTVLFLHGTGISISDSDAGTSPVEVTLSVTEGNLIVLPGLTGVVVTGSGSSSVTLLGTQTAINDLLAGGQFALIAYDNPSNSPAPTVTLSVLANDQGNTGGGGPESGGATATITITGINDPPVNTAPPSANTTEDTPLIFSAANGNAISIADDAGPFLLPVEITLDVTRGTLTLSQTTGLTFISGDGTNDASMTFRGTVASINAALNGLEFAPALNDSGVVTLTWTTDDLGNVGTGGSLTDTDQTSITIGATNDAPQITLPPDPHTLEDIRLVFTPAGAGTISISDADAGSAQVQASFQVNSGSMTLAQTAGLTFLVGSGTADPVIVVLGTIADINAAIQGATFNPLPDFNGSVNLVISVDDLGNTGLGGPQTATQTAVLAVTPVNDPPRFDILAPIAINPANITLVRISGVSAGPPDEVLSQTLTWSIASSNAQVLPAPVPFQIGPTDWLIRLVPAEFRAADITLRIVLSDSGPAEPINSVTQDFRVVFAVGSATPTVYETISDRLPPPVFPSVTIPQIETSSRVPVVLTPYESSASGGTAVAAGERKVEIYVVEPATGTPGAEPVVSLAPNVLNQLQRLYRHLPDDRYRVVLKLEDGSRRQVVEVVVRDGQPFDPGGIQEEYVEPAGEPSSASSEPWEEPSNVSADLPAEEPATFPEEHSAMAESPGSAETDESAAAAKETENQPALSSAWTGLLASALVGRARDGARRSSQRKVAAALAAGPGWRMRRRRR